MNGPKTSPPPAALRARRRRMLWALVATVVLPFLATALVAYVFKPGQRPSYGELVQPQRPVPALRLSTLDGRAVDLRRYDGYWLMVVAAPASCGQRCQHLLYDLRQFQIAAGDDRFRVARVWLITDQSAVNPGVLQPAAGTMMLRADPAQLRAWLPLHAGEGLEGPIWLVDPLGNLMMRFPADPDPVAALTVFKKLLYNTESWKPRRLEPLP